MNLGKILLLLLLSSLILGCATVRNFTMCSDFEKVAQSYAQLIRWNELESAMMTYVGLKERDEYLERIKAAKDVKFFDYRIKSLDCKPEKKEATAIVEFDYFRAPSVRVHTAKDQQKWSFGDENGKGSWQLKSPLPKFE
jgi:hypothetical protein